MAKKVIAAGCAVFLLTYVYLFHTLGDSFLRHSIHQVTLTEKSRDSSFTFQPSLKKSTYLLKVKHLYFRKSSMATELNGSMLQPFRTKKGRHIQTTWYLLRKSALREGTNQVTVRFAELAPPEVELRLQNLRISISGWLYCRFKDSVDSSVSAYAFVIHLVLFSLFYALCALGVMHLARRSSVDAYRCFTAVLFPIVSLSLFFILGDLFSHAYVIVVSRSFFVAYVLVCVSSGVVACFLHKHAAGFLSPLHILRHANFLFAVFACLMIFTALLCALDFDRIADRTTLAAYLCLCGYLLVRLPMLRRVPHTGAYRRTSA